MAEEGDDTVTGDLVWETLTDRLPPDVAASFTPEQRAALWEATKPETWRRHHPVHIRLSVPFIGGKAFVTIVGGPERRSPERLNRERRLYPLATAGNILFLMGLGGALFLSSLGATALVSRLIALP